MDASSTQASAPVEVSDGAAGMVSAEQALRPAEEMNALLIGFATGLLVGGFFLIYVVLAIANPTF